MSETPSYPALIELISRLEGADKKTAEMALYCLKRMDEKELKLFNEVQNLRERLAEADEANRRVSDDNQRIRQSIKEYVANSTRITNDMLREMWVLHISR